MHGNLTKTQVIDPTSTISNIITLPFALYKMLKLNVPMASILFFLLIDQTLSSMTLFWVLSGANNLIPMELALKIASKIRAKERFAVYIVIPMCPEGTVRIVTEEVLFWQVTFTIL